MSNDFKYISDQRTIVQLSRFNTFGSILIFLLIVRHNHWSLAPANMQTKQIYYNDLINGKHSDAGRDGGKVLQQLTSDMAKHTGADLYERE